MVLSTKSAVTYLMYVEILTCEFVSTTSMSLSTLSCFSNNEIMCLSQVLFFESTMRHTADCPSPGTPPPTLYGESSALEKQQQYFWWDSTSQVVIICRWNTDNCKAAQLTTRDLSSGKDQYWLVMSLTPGLRVESLNWAMCVLVRKLQECQWEFAIGFIVFYIKFSNMKIIPRMHYFFCQYRSWFISWKACPWDILQWRSIGIFSGKLSKRPQKIWFNMENATTIL